MRSSSTISEVTTEMMTCDIVRRIDAERGLKGHAGLRQVPIRFALAAVAAVMLLTTPAAAQLRIDITRGNIEPVPIAIPEFVVGNPEAAQIARDVAQVITNDLMRSGLFRPIDKRAFLEDPVGVLVTPNFNNWRVLSAEALVIGAAEIKADGELKVDFRLWDVFAEKNMTGLSLSAAPQSWRRVAHIVADTIYERMTGEQGYFDTRVVYISETGPKDNRVKRLAIMDQDGANHRFLTNGDTLVLTPRFSPSSQEITYLAYYNEQPRVYLFNIDTGEQEVLGDFPGMTFAPRFSPDGNDVVMSLAEQGNTDVYSMDLRTRRVNRLTRNPAIDTAPSYSPDGRQIVFESDRGGSQQLYVMDANGSDIKRISFGQYKSEFRLQENILTKLPIIRQCPP